MTNIKSVTPVTETFYALVTDHTVRLIFYTEDSAVQYLQAHNVHANTHIQKVYSETKMVEVEA